VRNKKKPWIGANVTEAEFNAIHEFAAKVERRSVAALIRLLLDDYMHNRLMRVPGIGESTALQLLSDKS